MDIDSNVPEAIEPLQYANVQTDKTKSNNKVLPPAEVINTIEVLMNYTGKLITF